MKKQQSDEWELFDVTKHILNSLDVKGVKRGECSSSWNRRPILLYVVIDVPTKFRAWRDGICVGGHCCEFGNNGANFQSGGICAVPGHLCRVAVDDHVLKSINFQEMKFVK